MPVGRFYNYAVITLDTLSDSFMYEMRWFLLVSVLLIVVCTLSVSDCHCHERMFDLVSFVADLCKWKSAIVIFVKRFCLSC